VQRTDQTPGSGSAPATNGESVIESPATESAVPGPGPLSPDSQKTVISKRPPASTPVFLRAANPFEMGTTLAGQQLGHFQLEEFVGGGGMGAVFRATDTMLGRTVAVKVISRDETNEDTLRRFRNEAQSAARLDHPNIARVYYVGEDQGWNYIVFEYIEGVNVRDLVEHNGPLSLEDAIRYTLQIAEALDHASQRDVIHRDIKPSNILIMLDGRAKLVDMGLARLHQVESPSEDLTASGVTLGTFDYISPEQARDPRNTDVRSDLYSLGCTLFYMLTGKPPFPEGTVLQKLLSHSGDEPPDVLTYRDDLPADMASVIKKMLAKSPDQRFQTPRALIGELLLLADRLNLTSITASSAVWLAPAQPTTTWWVRHLPWLAPACLLAAVVLVQMWLDSHRELPLPPPPQFVVRKESADDGADHNASQSTAHEPLAKPVSPSPAGKTDTKPDAKVAAPAAPTTGNHGAATDVGPERDLATSDPAARQATKNGSSTSPPNESSVPNTAAKSLPLGAGASRDTPAPAATEPPQQLAAEATAGTPTDATVPPDAPAMTSPHILIVSDEDIPLDGGMLRVRSFEEALTQAAQLAGVDEIQLRFNGISKLPPLDLDLDGFANGRLTIRAADGFAPIVMWDALQQPASEDDTSTRIRVQGGGLVWRDIHFFLNFPPGASDLTPQSLFQLDAVHTMEFNRCSFTVCNLTAEGLPASRAVALFELAPADELAGLLFDLEPFPEMPAIRLTDCAARGQTSLVRSAQARPFYLTWDHGVFISSEQLVDVAGAIVEPPWDLGRVTLSLKRLVVFADRGVAVMHTDSNAPYPTGMSVKAQACLFATRLTKPPTPLYLYRGSSPLAGPESQLLISGNDNFYKNTKVVLRVESSGDPSTLEEYSFDDLRDQTDETWYTERNALPATVFSWLPPARSVDRQQLDDFLSPGDRDGWFMGYLEIAPQALPRFPDYPSLLPRADLRLPQPSPEPAPLQ